MIEEIVQVQKDNCIYIKSASFLNFLFFLRATEHSEVQYILPLKIQPENISKVQVSKKR